MAHVYKRKGKETYSIAVKNAHGRRERRQTTTKSQREAERLANELQQIYDRQRLGLSPILPKDGGETLGDMLQWWLEVHSRPGQASHRDNFYRIRKHIMSSYAAKIPVYRLQSSDIEKLLQEKRGKIASKTINHIRTILSSAFNAAIRAERFRGVNPVDNVLPHKVVRSKKGDYLRPDEIVRVLDAATDTWRALFATAIYTGMRKGELFALQKSDIDLERGILVVCRSHERNIPKSGKIGYIPIADELRPYLAEAMQRSPNELVFPTKDGHRRPRDTKMPEKLRATMIRAGLIAGYVHKCGKHGCKYIVDSMTYETQLCPTHGVVLRSKPRTRKILFHDLRRTTGSMLAMYGADWPAIQTVMRHGSPQVTMDHYIHLAPGYLRTEINLLSFNKAEREPSPGLRLVKVHKGATTEPQEVVPGSESIGSLNQKVE